MRATSFIRRRRQALLSLAGLAIGATVAPAWAQSAWPSKPVRIVVPFAPGGIADLTARAVAEQMTRSLGQPVVVDNRPSAGSIVGSQAVAVARPDGHTLLLISASLRDLLAFAGANPGKLNVGTIAPGSTQHLSAKLFETVAGVDALVVPYKGSPAVLTALRAGEIDLAFEVVGPMLPQVSAGVVRALAVSSGQRNPALPEVPTVQQAGLAGYDVASWNGLAAPAGTPVAVLEALNRAVREAVVSIPVRDRLSRLGMRLQAGTPTDLQNLLTSEIKRWGDVIRAAKIEPQ